MIERGERQERAEDDPRAQDQPAEADPRGRSIVTRLGRLAYAESAQVVSPGSAPGELPQLPGPRPEGGARRTLLSAFVFVLLPTLVAAAYYYLFAADQYVAEFRFSVTEVNSVPTTATTSSSSSGGSLGGLAAIFGGGVGGASMQNYVVIDYLQSRQLVDELEKRIGLRHRFASGSSPADWWSGFSPSKPTERFMEYWGKMVQAAYDPTTSLASVQVRSFTAVDSKAIADAMVTAAEELVNRIEKRVQMDAVRFAESQAEKAHQRLKDVRAQIAEYRASEGVIDPAGTVSTNIELVKNMRANILQMQTELASLSIQQLPPTAPAVVSLRSRIAGAQEQLKKIEREVGRERQDNRALSEVVARYEQLDLDRQYAQAMLVSTQQALDTARANAASQHLYLTPYVSPALPESADYPKRARQTLIVFLSLLLAWICGMMLVRSVREHLS